MYLHRLAFSAFATLPIIWCAAQLPTIAQIVPDRTLGSESSVVTPNQNIRGIPSDRIDGGAVRGGNLFHSFQEFNVDVGRGAYFSNPDNIINILTRVTGGNISEIMGTLGVLGNANFFLINPNGIVFGPNARLDVGGSFFASTADGILFENGIEFAASNPEAPPLLTINIPIGLNLRENPGAIVNQVIPELDNTGNFTGLEVPFGNSLVLLGGDINIDGGGISVPGGRIELAGLASEGFVRLNVDDNNHLSLSFPEDSSYANLTLSNDAQVVLGGLGNIVINTGILSLSNGAAIVSDLFGLGDAGSIYIQATEAVSLSNSNILSGTVDSQGSDIIIETGLLSLTDGAVLFSTTFGQGNAGNINIRASGVVSLVGSNILNDTDTNPGQGGNVTIEAASLSMVNSNIFLDTDGTGNSGNIFLQTIDQITLTDGSNIRTDVDADATGQGGNITIETGRLTLRDGSVIRTDTSGMGDGGNLIVNANDIELIGISADGETSSSLQTRVLSGATGNAGNMTISTGNLRLLGGAQISTVTSGGGNAGNMTITGNQIEVIGTDIQDDLTFISNQTNSTGASGSLAINTETLSVRDGGQVFVRTTDSGDAGDFTIRANQVEVIGGGDNFASLVFNTANQGATGQGGDLNIDTNRLLISDGAQVGTGTFSEGNAGDIFISANDIQLRGTSPNGRGSVLSNSVQPNATGNGGRLNIKADRLTVRDGSQVLANTESVGNGGELIIKAAEIEVSGFSISEEGIVGSLLSTSTITTPGGQGGSLTIETDHLVVRDGAQVLTNTFGSGNAGDLTIYAETIEVIGASINAQFPTSLSSNTNSTGQSGTLTINTEQLRVNEGGQITVSTEGSGNAGELIVRAIDIELVGTLTEVFPNNTLLSASTDAEGQGGNLNIETERLTLLNGAQIIATTFSSGNAGNLTIQADEIDLVGISNNGQQASGFAVSVSSDATGQGGQMLINTGRLNIRNGAQILADTNSSGDGGDITINASEIEMMNPLSFIAASVDGEDATGNAGNLIISTERLSVRDGAQIDVSTFGLGNAGTLEIQATDVELSENSSIDSTVEPGATGDGGTIEIQADAVRVENEAGISVSSRGTGNAGNLIINTPLIRLDNQAELTAETAVGNQGNITIQTEDIRLQGNSRITTNATGVATGGNIEINTDTLIAIEDSDISANAQAAFGGQVIIRANAIFGTEFRQQPTGASDITATSELGPDFSGTVDLDSEIDPAQGLVELPQTVVDPAALIAQDPCKLGRNSEFFITGRGGLIPDPTQELTIIEGFVEWESFITEPVTSQADHSAQRRQQRTRKRDNNRDDHPIDSRTIVPARGWIRTEEGEIILVGYDPTKTGVQRQPQNPYSCQS